MAQNATCCRAVPLRVKAHGAQGFDELFADLDGCFLAFLHGGETEVQLAVVDNPADVLAVAIDITAAAFLLSELGAYPDAV